jgi:NitT/TauT family transport system substrate-binding protein
MTPMYRPDSFRPARRLGLRLAAACTLVAATLAAVPAQAADTVKLGVFPSSAALPFYIAVNRGYFKEAGLEVEEVPMTSHPLTVQAIVSDNIDGAANLVKIGRAHV